MTITKQLYDQIAAVCEQSVNIAIIGDNIFLYNSFQPSSSGNTSSIDFCTIFGINVTEFFSTNRIDPTIGRQSEFTSKFTKYIEFLPLLNIKFNKSTEYYLFSK